MFGLAADFLLLLASIGVLVYAADLLVDRAAKLARILGVSGVVIGLTLLAIGTTMPEFAVTSTASLQAHGEIAVANIVGTDIYNVALIFGLVALFVPFAWKDDLRRNGILMVAAVILLTALAFLGGISSLVGVAMFIAFLAITYYFVKTAKREKRSKREKGSVPKELALCILLLACVLVAGYFTVQFAVETARLAGVSEWLIGATIIAAGTSAPETVVALVSMRKRQMGMSLGDIVGASYLNIIWTLGVASALRPLTLSIADIGVDLAFLCLITGLFFYALLRRKLTRLEGMLYLAIYGLYLLYLLKIVSL
jgi:cation:H+ antiporter